MDFHEIWTYYEWFKKASKGSDKDKGWRQFYSEAAERFLLEQLKDDNQRGLTIGTNHLLSERSWHLEGKPYYKVWPAIIDSFVRTRIDINANLLNVPHGCFGIRLPKDEKILSFTHGDMEYAVKTILVYSPNVELKSENTDILFRKYHKCIMIWIDVGEMIEGVPNIYYHRAIFEEGNTIEQGFGNIVDSNPLEGVVLPASIIEACVRLVVGVCFLATGSHKILEYDVLRKHLEAYQALKEDHPKRQFYKDKAKRIGKFGWHIGRGRNYRELTLPRGITYADAVHGAGGRHLLYQHSRGGHWHTVRFGQKLSQEKVVWYDEIIVKPTLPPKPI